MLEVKKFIFSPFQENTFVVFNPDTKETMIIDPGCIDDMEKEELSNYITENSLKIKYLINTHCHIDHIFGNAYVKNTYNPVYYAPEKDEFLLDEMVNQARLFGVEFEKSPRPDKYIDETLKLYLGSEEIEFLFTPGHTPGEYSLYIKNCGICFAGDVLFLEGIGRTDLWGGNMQTLINSIKTKLLTLPDETIVYSGHGDTTTIRHEKYNNPYLF